MKNLLSTYRSRLTGSSLCELVEILGENVPLPDPGSWSRNRVFNPWRTFWLFLGQVLNADRSCREALRKAQVWFFHSTGDKKKMPSSSTSAYCQARSRLDPGYLDHVHREVVQRVESQTGPEHLWYGRRVRVVDGSWVSMPDTQSNRERYPRPGNRENDYGFPVMRFVAVFCLTTGIIVNCRRGSRRHHERTLWRQMWDCCETGDVVLADRGFLAYADYVKLSKRNVDCVMRLGEKRPKELRVVKRFNRGDCLVTWQKGKQPPNWLTSAQWDSMPEQLTVRYVTVRTAVPGFRASTVVLATTLLDPEEFPAEALAKLYLKRWRAELFLRHLKTTMGMDVLRCKTPHMIRKEFSMFIIAYNLIRSLIWQTALSRKMDPYFISLAGTIALIRQGAPILAHCTGTRQKAQFLALLWDLIACDVQPKRKTPLKARPRVVKPRPANPYRLPPTPAVREVANVTKIS